MKKFLSFLLIFTFVLSTFVLPVTSEENATKYKLVFEDNLDGKLASYKAWWDPKGTQSLVGGPVSFKKDALILGSNGYAGLISSGDSKEAADFNNGILQLDLTWGAAAGHVFYVEFGVVGGTRSCDVHLYADSVYVRHNGKLTNITSGILGVVPPAFELGKTYRIFYQLIRSSNTEFRVYCGEFVDGKEPTDYTLIGKGTSSDLQSYTGGGALRFRSTTADADVMLDNIKVYLPDDAGTETLANLMPGYNKTETMSEAELMEYMGYATQEEVAKSQRANGEYYNLVLEDDMSNGDAPWWDPTRKILGAAGHTNASFANGELVLDAGGKKAIAKAEGYEAAANFNRGIYEFDFRWEGEVGGLMFSIFGFQGELLRVLTDPQGNISTTQFSWTRYLNRGAEGVVPLELTADKNYNLKIYIEKIPGNVDACMVKIYLAEYKNGKLGNHELIGWGECAENLYEYAGGGYVRITNNTKTAKLVLDNLKIYVPADDEKTDDSVHMKDIFHDYDKVQKNFADACAVSADEEGIHMLERIGMIIGEGDGVTESYLKTRPTRVQAAVLTLRLRGLEEEAKAFESNDNFADIDNVGWAKNILAYIKAHPELGMVGVGDNCFDPMAPITQQAYVKILLESLGYKYNEDFSWGEVLSFAKAKGMNFEETAEFNVREVAKTTKAGLYTPMKNEGAKVLFAKIISDREGINDPEYANAPALTEEFKALKEEAKHKDYGMMVNTDGDDAVLSNTQYYMSKGYTNANDLPDSEVTIENFYKWRLDNMLDPDAPQDIKGVTNVGTLVYCAGAGTKVGLNGEIQDEAKWIKDRETTYWDGRLYEKTGKDNLTLAIEWARKNNFPVFASYRMNDNHDGAKQEHELNEWKVAHLDNLMARRDNSGPLAFGSRAWSVLDFSYAESREGTYNLLKTLVKNYDIDGLELDFFRHLTYFKEVILGEKVYPESIQKMNDLMRAIRKMADAEGMKRGKAIPIAIKIPDSLPYCYNVGLDIQTWLDEGLVDIVSCGGYWSLTNWDESVDYFQNRNNTPFYACLSRDTIHTCRNYDRWRNEAALAWQSGAKGISTFNILQGNEDVFRIIDDPESAGVPDPGYEKIEFNYTNGRYWPCNWIRDGVSYRFRESYPENWSKMSHGEKIYFE